MRLMTDATVGVAVALQKVVVAIVNCGIINLNSMSAR